MKAILDSDVIDLEFRVCAKQVERVSKEYGLPLIEVWTKVGDHLSGLRRTKIIPARRSGHLAGNFSRGVSAEHEVVNNQVNSLREKVLDALARLEQMDIEG